MIVCLVSFDKTNKNYLFSWKKTLAAMKSIGSLFFFLDENLPKKPRNALKKMAESKFHRVTKTISFNIL